MKSPKNWSSFCLSINVEGEEKHREIWRWRDSYRA